MLELDGLLALILIGLWLFCLFDAITAPTEQIRNLPKPLWIILMIILPDIGSILWLVAGRPKLVGGSMPYKGNTGTAPRVIRGRATSRAIAPDDNPDFLRQLGTSNTEHETLLNQWEADLRRREQELRNKPEDPQVQP